MQIDAGENTPYSMPRWPSNEYKYSLEGRIAHKKTRGGLTAGLRE